MQARVSIGTSKEKGVCAILDLSILGVVLKEILKDWILNNTECNSREEVYQFQERVLYFSFRGLQDIIQKCIGVECKGSKKSSGKQYVGYKLM